MDKILVTGASGFLGEWVVRDLLKRGHFVRVLHRKSSDLSGLPSHVEKHIGDVTNIDSLLSALEGIDGVFHLAGLIEYKRSERQRMYDINVGGTRNVLKACQSKGVRKLLYLSSVTAIGASFDKKTLLNEDSEYNVKHLGLGYFDSKHEAEKCVMEAVRSGKMEAKMVNPSTIYGPGDAKKGSRKTMVKVAKGEFPFYTCGGVNVISVHDVVEASYRAYVAGRPGERYILAGENIRIKDLFKEIADIAGVRPPRIYLPRLILFVLGFAGDFMNRFSGRRFLSVENAWTSTLFHWFDNTKAKRELGLNPRPAKEALRESVVWMKDNGLV